MADREPRLGRGLESLIPRAPSTPQSQEPAQGLRDGASVRDVPVEAISPNPFQPRRDFAPDALNDLVESLRIHGLLQPIVVRRRGSAFQLVAGERRWRAAQELGWPSIRSSIVDFDDNTMLEAALIENVQREDLNPIELAMAYKEMQETLHLTQDELARRVGKSRSSVANALRLLDLPTSTKAQVAAGAVSMGAARALLALPEGELEHVAERVAAGELSVRQVEALARKPREASSSTATRRRDPNLDALAEDLQRDLGTRVEIRGKMDKGKLEIAFHSAAQLDLLVRLLRRQSAATPPSESASSSITI